MQSNKNSKKALLKYHKPKIISKSVMISFFMSKVWWIDQFNFTGNVYAQSGISVESVASITSADAGGDICACTSDLATQSDMSW